ncbi:transglycosylase SLT domain-containing protein [Aeromonas hydrophila]|uniref:transglycosylase SLT domain-containing protein n=1 Tax=Aeromonas hydrophila TaxID=644 RepID=UPI003D22DF6E
MTDESNHIERADIGEAHIAKLDVGSMNFGASVNQLAKITSDVQRQGKKSIELLKSIIVDEKPNQEEGEQSGDVAGNGKLQAAKKENSDPKTTNQDQYGRNDKNKGAKAGRIGSAGLLIVEQTPPKLDELGAKKQNSGPQKAESNPKSVDGGSASLPAQETDKTRKNRTIEISPAQVAAGDPPKSAGFYLGDDGRVRRPDGTFASKVEVRRFTNDQGGGEGGKEGGEYKHSFPALMARAVGAMMTIAGKGDGKAGGQAGDVAGVAAGGSIFLSLKELGAVMDDTKEALKERGITKMSAIAPYLKSQFGTVASRVGLPVEGNRRPPKQFAVAGTTQTKSAQANQQDKQAAQSKVIAEKQSQQSEVQHDELLKKLDEVAEEIKPKGPGLLDSALDMAGDMFGGRKGRAGKRGRGRARRLSGTDFEPRTRGEARTRKAPRPRRPEAPRGPGKLAKIKAGMGRGLEAMPSVATAAGRTGGSLVKRGAAAGGAAIGRMAGMGARAIPLVGQAIALGLAAYDGYDGYNDKEGQARAFNLKGEEDATTGQKSAMAAARVLDLGGLTSGAAGLLGTAAGAMGFKKLQEALSFDSDDMARAIYEGMTIFDRKKPKDRDRASETTINNITNNSGVTNRGLTDSTGDWKGTPLKFDGAEAESGLPPGYLAATLAVESGGNWNAVNAQSGATGGFQFIPKTAAGLGLSMQDAFDPAKSTKAMIEHTKQNQAYFEKTMGRSPEGRELYLMHQQGMGGGTKLLQNPDALATDVVGVKAVLQNGGRADMTAKEFSDLVLNKYDKAEAYNKANPGKAVDMDAVVGSKPKYEAPEMLRGGPRPGEVAPSLVPPPSLSAPTAPAALAAPTAKAVQAPVALQPVSDIQVTVSQNELKAQDKKPYAPSSDPNVGMLTVLKSMDKTLKDMNKSAATPAPSGGPLRSGGKAPVSGHPTMAGPMADFANDKS